MKTGKARSTEAEITKLKDGRTALAYKAENAVDMETGAIVAVTTHGGAAADTATSRKPWLRRRSRWPGLDCRKDAEGPLAHAQQVVLAHQSVDPFGVHRPAAPAQFLAVMRGRP
jgi:hypothetical protein